MIKMQNSITLIDKGRAFWKIWKDEPNLLFYMATAFDDADDNKLVGVERRHEMKILEQNEVKYLFVVNPTL